LKIVFLDNSILFVLINKMTTTTISRKGAYAAKTWNDIPDEATFNQLFNVQIGDHDDTSGESCSCGYNKANGLAGYCPVNEMSVSWPIKLNRAIRCTCFTDNILHCPKLGKNAASTAVFVGSDVDGPTNFFNKYVKPGCKNDTCEKHGGTNYRAGFNCMTSSDLRALSIPAYTAKCTYPAATIPDDGDGIRGTNDLPTLNPGIKEERQLIKNYCWRIDPKSTAHQPYAITNPDCHVLRKDNSQYTKEVENWCTGKLEDLVVDPDPKDRTKGRDKSGIFNRGMGGCDCWNDLKYNQKSASVIKQTLTDLRQPADCGWAPCLDPRSTSLATNLYPDEETPTGKCPPPPKCQQIINITDRNKISAPIGGKFTCVDGPGNKPGPGPAPAPGPPVGSLKIAGGGGLVLVALAVLFFVLHRKSTDPTSLFGFLGIQNKSDFLGGLTGILVCITVLIFMKSREY
jgi:hypothetical protein